jgi:hypothetical protein
MVLSSQRTLDWCWTTALLLIQLLWHVMSAESSWSAYLKPNWLRGHPKKLRHRCHHPRIPFALLNLSLVSVPLTPIYILKLLTQEPLDSQSISSAAASSDEWASEHSRISRFCSHCWPCDSWYRCPQETFNLPCSSPIKKFAQTWLFQPPLSHPPRSHWHPKVKDLAPPSQRELTVVPGVNLLAPPWLLPPSNKASPVSRKPFLASQNNPSMCMFPTNWSLRLPIFSLPAYFPMPLIWSLIGALT